MRHGEVTVVFVHCVIFFSTWTPPALYVLVLTLGLLVLMKKSSMSTIFEVKRCHRHYIF